MTYCSICGRELRPYDNDRYTCNNCISSVIDEELDIYNIIKIPKIVIIFLSLIFISILTFIIFTII
jgi:hypothetical protein